MLGDYRMEFKDIVMKRYATKKFDDKTIPDEKVEELKQLIQFAPSSFNLQPWKIKVITDKETKEKLLPASMNQPQIMSCSHLLIFCADSDLIGLIEKMKNQMLENSANEDSIKGYIDMMTGFANNLSQEDKWTH